MINVVKVAGGHSRLSTTFPLKTNDREKVQIEANFLTNDGAAVVFFTLFFTM